MFNKFFRTVSALVAKTQPNKVVRWCPDGEFLAIFCPVFPASHVQHIPDLHSKFALRPHHVWKYGSYQSVTDENMRGKKKEEKKRKNRTKV